MSHEATSGHLYGLQEAGIAEVSRNCKFLRPAQTLAPYTALGLSAVRPAETMHGKNVVN